MDNLRLAQEWAITRGDAEAEWRLVAALALFWVLRGYLREGAERIDSGAVARRMRPTRRCGRGSSKAPGLLAHWSGDDERAVAHFEGSLAAAQAAGETAPWQPVCSAGWGPWRTPGATSPARAPSSPRC